MPLQLFLNGHPQLSDVPVGLPTDGGKPCGAVSVSYTHLDVYKRQREDYRLSTLNCGGEDFAVACMRSNLRYEKNQRREDVKSHHLSLIHI